MLLKIDPKTSLKVKQLNYMEVGICVSVCVDVFIIIINSFDILLWLTYVSVLDNIQVLLSWSEIISDYNFHIIKNPRRIFIGPYNTQRHPCYTKLEDI